MPFTSPIQESLLEAGVSLVMNVKYSVMSRVHLITYCPLPSGFTIQESLLETGVSLVMNVKHSVMSRVQRSTRAKPVKSIEELVTPPVLGYAANFLVKTFTLPNGKVYLVVSILNIGHIFFLLSLVNT